MNKAQIQFMNKEFKNLYENSDIPWDKFRDSTVLITGATGMVGSYLVYYFDWLNSFDSNLNIYVIGTYRDLDKIVTIGSSLIHQDKFEYMFLDMELCEWPEYRFVDYIFHTASPASSHLYNTNPLSVIAPNVLGTQLLLNIGNIDNFKGMVFFSSGEVMGKIDVEFADEKTYGHLDPTDIRSCYGESKRMGENLCKCYSHQYGIHAVSVRLDHTYGITMDLENDNRVFAEFVFNIVKNGDIIIKSDGLSIRTFVYLSDAVRGIFTALLKGNSGETYNVSNNDCRVTVKELAENLILLYPEKNLQIVYENRNADGIYLENTNKFCSSLDTRKIEKLGYKCDYDLKGGFEKVVEFFKLNKE